MILPKTMQQKVREQWHPLIQNQQELQNSWSGSANCTQLDELGWRRRSRLSNEISGAARQYSLLIFSTIKDQLSTDSGTRY